MQLGVVLRTARCDADRDVSAIVRDLDAFNGARPPALVRGSEGDRGRIDEQSHRTSEPVTFVQLGDAFASESLEVEIPIARPSPIIDYLNALRGVELSQSCEQTFAAGDAVQHGPGVIGLRFHPLLDLGILQVLHPAVVVDDLGAEIVVRDRAHRGDGRARLRQVTVELDGRRTRAHERAGGE